MTAMRDAGGMTFYALAFLLSHLFRGEYTVPGVALGLTAATYVLVKIPELGALDVFKLMTGSEYMPEGRYLLGGAFPTLPLVGCLLLAALSVAYSDRIARKRQF